MKKTIIAAALLVSFDSMAHDIPFEHTHDQDGAGYTVTETGMYISDTDVKAEHWNARGKSQTQVDARAAYMATFFNHQRSPEDTAKDEAFREELGKDTVYVNTVLPAAIGAKSFTKAHAKDAWSRNEKAGVTLGSMSNYNNPKSQITTERDTFIQTAEYGEKMGYRHIRTVAEVRKNWAEGVMSLTTHAQGADFVIADMGKVKEHRDLGVMQMNFVYNDDNALAGGGTNNDKGVTELGKEFIKAANENGVLIDVSHSSSQTAIDAAKYSTKPIIASHSNSQALHPIGRNISDEAMIAIANTGGVVCSTGVGMFLNAEGDASPEAMAKHVVHTANLIGKDKTCFSTDFLHNYQDFVSALLPDTETYAPEAGMSGLTENITIEQGWGVARVLHEQYGWTIPEVRGFLGENVLALYEQIWDEYAEAQVAHLDAEHSHDALAHHH
ncbi:dipeptidase [Vibrio halioticoli]|uniref:dipeptidase n=1 Tax=Vibrio halioticoli TaxID=71388 RepID=UPI000E5B5C5F|nr:membrane dipeptidase [Vibrio halioticoli]